MSATATAVRTVTDADIAAVLRRVTADLVMIAQSTGAITEQTARDYAYDIEVLALAQYLRMVDVTLLSGGAYGTEWKAIRYVPNNAAGDLTSGRPGGVRWPRVPDPYLRIVLYHTDSYDAAARAHTASKLKVTGSPVTRTRGISACHSTGVATT